MALSVTMAVAAVVGVTVGGLVPGAGVPAADAATALTVAPGFGAYAPESQWPSSSQPVTTTFSVTSLVSGGDGSIGSITVSTAPASGTATADSSAGTIAYTPASTTSGTQTVGITVCDTASPADCGSGTVTFAPASPITVVYDCPSPLSGTGTQPVAVALDAPTTVASSAQFPSTQAAAPAVIPSTEECNGTTITVSSVSTIETVVPVPSGASYVSGTAQLTGGDPTTDSHTVLLYCTSTSSTTPTEVVPASGSGSCNAQTGTSTYPSSGTQASSWQTTAPYFELVTSGVDDTPGTVVDEPSVTATFTATGADGTTIAPALTEFSTTATASAYGVTETSTVYGAPSTSAPFGTTTIASAPGAPTITSVQPGAGSLTVTFDAPSSDGGDPITSYQVSCAPPSGSPTTVTDTDVSAQPLAQTVTGLTDGTTYACTVAATNAVGTGPASTAVDGTPQAPPTVSSVSPSSGTTAGGALVTVDGTGFDGATAVTFGSTAASSFTVQSSTSLTATSPAATSTGTVNITVTTPAGTSAAVTADQFTYTASSGSGTGTGSSGSGTGTSGSGTSGTGTSGSGSGTSGSGTSGSGTGSTQPPGTEPPPPAPIPVTPPPPAIPTGTGTPPAAPTDLVAAPADGAVTLSWSAPSPPSVVTAYLIGVTPACATCQGLVVPGDRTTTAVVGLPNGVLARFQVAAVGAAGAIGSLSTPAFAVPDAEAGCPSGSPGLWLAGWSGAITTVSTGSPLPSFGTAAGRTVAAVVGVVAAAGCQGYWEVATNGGVFAFGDAGFHGAAVDDQHDGPAIGLAPTPSGGGYWVAHADGTVTALGDAPVLETVDPVVAGDQPVVAVAADPDGVGYWLVSATGAVYAFGSAPYLGSLPGDRIDPSAPIVAMAPTPDGHGYWLLGADGAVYAFGDADYAGGAPASPAPEGTSGGAPVRWTAIVPVANGGYWLVDAAGQVVARGTAPSLRTVGAAPSSIVWAAAAG